MASAATAPSPASTEATVMVRASARVLAAASVRQGEPVASPGPAMQITRRNNGEVLLEYT